MNRTSLAFVPGPRWLEKAVFYQIYPQSFLDTNGDGIGDLRGVIRKLDYVASLGCTALWLNPCFVSPFKDAGYDVSDFLRVDRRYGSNADLERLFREAHARGLKVVLDLVAGHTSVEHPWFKASCLPKRNRYSDYFIWTSSMWEHAKGFPQINGFAERDGNYLTNFFWFQPALNYGFAKPDPAAPWQQPIDAPGPKAVRRELKKIMRFWLDKGCDGFRVDMASSLIRGDEDGSAIRALWQDFRAWLDKDYPEAVLVSEWSNPEKAIGAGFHIDFMIHFNEPAYVDLCNPWGGLSGKRKVDGGFFTKAGPRKLGSFVANYLRHYEATRHAGFIALPTGNHDYPRFIWGRDSAQMKVFLALLFTMPGVPFLYYGDEIGLPYQAGLVSKEGGYGRTGTRCPMQWDATENAGFSRAKPSLLYLPVDRGFKRLNVEAQSDDPASLLSHTRTLLALRRQQPSLGNAAAFQPLVYKGDGAFVFERGQGGERIFVAVNPSEQPCSARFSHPELRPLLTQGVSVSGHGLDLKPLSFGIFSLSTP